MMMMLLLFDIDVFSSVAILSVDVLCNFGSRAWAKREPWQARNPCMPAVASTQKRPADYFFVIFFTPDFGLVAPFAVVAAAVSFSNLLPSFTLAAATCFKRFSWS